MNEFETKSSSLFGLIWERLWVLVLAGVMGATLAFVYASTQPPVYEARTTILVDETPSTRTNYEDVLANERRAQTYAYLFTSRTLLQKVIEVADKTAATPEQIEALMKSLDVQAIKGTQLIGIAVRDTSPTRAFVLTRAMVDSFSNQLSLLYEERNHKTKSQIDKQLKLVSDQIQQTTSSMTETNADSQEQFQPLLTQYRQTQADLVALQTQLQLDEVRGQLGIAQIEMISVSDRPVAPNMPLLVAIGSTLGILLGIAIVMVSEIIVFKKATPSGSNLKKMPRRSEPL